jgi:hypothetical protein
MGIINHVSGSKVVEPGSGHLTGGNVNMAHSIRCDLFFPYLHIQNQ